MTKTQPLPGRRRITAVFAGGFLGAIARALVSSFLQAELGKAWPYDILLINLTGAFVLAFVTTLADARLWIGPTRRLFINVGFLGAYTTFSSLMLGDVLLAQGGHWWGAASYLLISLVGGLLAVLLGDLGAQFFIARQQKRLLPTKRISTQELFAPLLHEKREHLDMQDDVLVSEQELSED
ncbi:fluoride efflux transporter FluC [Tengunoibacter tsumagoiensis]|uniref:Fluoride-specific ion channel FluC n=1 Tax=Tengunoibacter tsumagoiensis TaxID=2014871 RepID=A0A402A6E2_9CHLR|nr:CrcB family protein [Tengunoibacter tsumagoiensis]GCE14717.1 hypothetical protein KTT_45760 [Tengunoibacter tsumagoiensis]